MYKEDEYDLEEEIDQINPNLLTLKVRLDDKDKIHVISLYANDPLSAIIDSLPISLPDDDEEILVKSTNADK